MKLITLLLFAFLLSSCERQYFAPSLYQAETPDCRHWADGSSFQLAQGISVFAGQPEYLASGSIRLRISYFIPRGKSVEFSNQEFSIVEPGGSVGITGSISSASRYIVNLPDQKEEAISSLPLVLEASSIGDETMIRAKVDFSSPPKRFDLAHPQMIVLGRSYPVRIYTYRWFEDRQQYGLCI